MAHHSLIHVSSPRVLPSAQHQLYKEPSREPYKAGAGGCDVSVPDDVKELKMDTQTNTYVHAFIIALLTIAKCVDNSVHKWISKVRPVCTIVSSRRKERDNGIYYSVLNVKALGSKGSQSQTRWHVATFHPCGISGVDKHTKLST